MTLRALVLALALAPAVAHAVEEPGVTTAKIVSVRREPNPQSKLVTQLKSNHEIVADKYQDGWVHIRFYVTFGIDVIAMEGWVEEKYLRSKSRHGFFFQRGEAEPSGTPEGGAEGGGEGGGEAGEGGEEPGETGPELPTGILVRAGPAVVISSFSLSAPGVEHDVDPQQHLGAEVLGTYWASELVGVRVRAVMGEGTIAAQAASPAFARDPLARETDVSTRVTMVGGDVVLRRAFGVLLLEGAAGVETIDFQAEEVRGFLVSHRYTGATVGGRAGLRFGDRVHLYAGGRYWVAPVASETDRDPFTGAGPTGYVDGATAFGGEAGLEVRVGKRWHLSAEGRYTAIETEFRGGGVRFGDPVDGATTTESFLGGGLTLVYAL